MSCMKAQRLCDTLASHENNKKDLINFRKNETKKSSLKSCSSVSTMYFTAGDTKQNIRQCHGDDVNDIN